MNEIEIEILARLADSFEALHKANETYEKIFQLPVIDCTLLAEVYDRQKKDRLLLIEVCQGLDDFFS